MMQAMIPFSEDELEYIARLDAEADMDLLRRELPSLREESLRTLQVATILLQRCAAAGDPPAQNCHHALNLHRLGRQVMTGWMWHVQQLEPMLRGCMHRAQG